LWNSYIYIYLFTCSFFTIILLILIFKHIFQLFQSNHLILSIKMFIFLIILTFYLSDLSSSHLMILLFILIVATFFDLIIVFNVYDCFMYPKSNDSYIRFIILLRSGYPIQHLLSFKIYLILMYQSFHLKILNANG
jgi:hypothetical protein